MCVAEPRPERLITTHLREPLQAGGQSSVIAAEDLGRHIPAEGDAVELDKGCRPQLGGGLCCDEAGIQGG